MNEEIEALLRKSEQSIEGAKLLFERELFGFAVSRAYYAMFYLVEAFLLSKGLSFSKHGACIAAFGKHFAKTKVVDIKFHRYLIEAFEQRQIGDYEAMEFISQETAQKTIDRAIKFLNLAREYFKEEKSD